MTTPARPLAVVTGASSGIGYELAVQFADHGFDLLVTAEDAAITGTAQALRDHHGAAVTSVQVDLSTYDGVEELWTAVRSAGRPVDALALNAGIGQGGDFVRQTDLADELRIIDLNIKSTVHLAKRVLPGMVERGEGRVLVTSSIASTMPGTFQAVYNASKSFEQSWSEAVREEIKDTGVTITALMPGPTETEFFERADMLDTKVGASSKDDPAQVAKQGFEAMMAGKEKVVGGSLSTRAQAAAAAVLPDSVKAKGHRRMAEPGSGS